MTARLRPLGIAALLTGAAVGGWIGWRMLHAPSVGLRGGLTLQVESRDRIEVLPGTPIVFDVYLTAAKGLPHATVGRAGRPWRSMLRLIEDRSHKPLAWTTVAIGPPQSISYATTTDGREEGPQKTADVAVVDHDHVHHLTLATSPETMSAVPPGTYSVRAVLESESWPPWRSRRRLESAPVTVTVRHGDAAENRDGLERDRLVASADFYLQTKRFDKARRLAEELASREPRNAGVWMLLGDALDGAGKPREALNVYRRALAVSPRTYEEPTLLYERIAKVMRKLSR